MAKMVAWFVCRAAGITDDIDLPIKAGVVATDEEFARKGRMRAARVFKRRHGLHPSRKVDCEFQFIHAAALCGN